MSWYSHNGSSSILTQNIISYKNRYLFIVNWIYGKYSSIYSCFSFGFLPLKFSFSKRFFNIIFYFIAGLPANINPFLRKLGRNNYCCDAKQSVCSGGKYFHKMFTIFLAWNIG